MSSGEEVQEEHLSDEFDNEAGKYDKNESFAEESIQKRPLTKSIIAECISMPYRLGYGFSHAFIKLDCTDKHLSDVNVLHEYIHLRFVILSNNFITDISPISCIGHLLYLKADNNQITSAESLKPLRFLQFLDLSNNKLTTINNLSFPLLQHLKVNENLIENFGGGISRDQLPGLYTLEIRGNRLQSLNGLGSLFDLKSIYCAENNIRSLEGLNELYSLVRLHVRDNQLSSLAGLSNKLANLEYLNLRGNRISKFREVKSLECLPALKILSLLDNPITERDNYRTMVIGCLNKLQRLDKDLVNDSERYQAANFVRDNSYIFEEELHQSDAFEEHHNVDGHEFDKPVTGEDDDAEEGEQKNEEEEEDN